MARSPEETYIQTYKKYLKQKDNSDDLRKPHSTASTKLLKPMPKPQECKICTVLAKPQDLYKVLNEGLYHKYTASQDYFYTRDINALLARKRKTFCVRYNDDLIFDECKERLKGYFKKRDALSLMTEIKDFYTKFKNFPRNFHAHFSRIINSNIRKHRRLEYMIVFNNPNFDESRPPAEDPDASNNGQFNFMEMLGNSFLQDNYRDMSGIVVGDLAVSKAYTGESSVREIAANFKALYNIQPNTISDPASEPFSNALYNKNYMLYSRSDSTTAEDILKQIVNEFREGDLVKKPAMTLAEKVMQQVSANPKNPRKQENRYSPTLKQRAGTGETEVSSLLQASKKSLGSSTSNLASSLMQSQKQPNQANQPLTTSQRGASNPRSNSHIETDNASIVGKIGQKLNSKFSVENLNDVVINRNKILSKLYQFRSTRSKSGGLKSVGSAATGSKTPSGMGRRPVGFNFDTQGYDSTDSKQLTTVFYTHEKSHSNSPERRISKDRADKSTEILAKSKLGVDSPYYSALTRSTSFGPNGEFRAAGSPTHPHGNRSSTHKKSNSAARRSLATPKKQSIGPMIQNYILNGHNNSGEGSANNLSHNHYNPTPTPNHQGNHGNPASPVGGKFINLVRPTTSNPQTYYFRHQSPMEEKIQVSGVLQKVKSEARIKNLNMRALKNTSPKRMENYRMATMSMSGRHQTMLDLSHGVNSFAGPQSSMQLANGSSHGSKSRNLRKSDANLLGSKVAKRSSMIQSQAVVSSSEDVDEKRSKKVLELSNGNINTYKDLKLPSKEQTPMNYFPSSATSLQKFRSELKRGTIGSYSLKGSSKELKLGAKK